MADEHGSRFRLSLERTRAARPAARAARRRRPTGARRIRSRLLVCAVLFAAWTVGIEARLFYLQVVAARRHDGAREPPAAQDHQAAGQARRDRRSRRPRARLQRRRRHHRRRSLGHRRSRTTSRGASAARSTTATPAQQQLDGRAAARQGAVRLPRAAGVARRGAPRQGARPARASLFYKESRRYYPKQELAAHVLGYVGSTTTGLAGLESAFDARIRGREGKMLLQTDARRHACRRREERPPTAGDGSS